MSYLLPGLYGLSLYSAYLAGYLYLRSQTDKSTSAAKQTIFRFRKVTVSLLLVIAIPSILEFFFPVILLTLERDASRFLDGEWWRIFTSLFVQDGGISGAIFNLVVLLFVGLVAEQLWDAPKMLLIFFAGGLVGEIVGLVWQPIGAGNSVANFSLAASVAVLCLLRRPPKPVQIAAFVALGTDLVLIALRDIHGPAAIGGALLAVALGMSGTNTEDN